MINEKALVSPEAILAKDVIVGPFTIIGPEVEIGSGTEIGSHTIIEGQTRIGKNNKISHHVVIGTPPQDLKYQGEKTRVDIGDNNIIREFVTIHRGTIGGHALTKVGNRNMIMAYVHIAHDCAIGDEVIIANAVNMAGHVTIEDYAIIGGMCALHQFIRIGRYAFIGGGTAIAQDIIPFGLAAGVRGRLEGINTIGLRRREFSHDRRRAIHKTVRLLLDEGLNLTHAIEKIKSEFSDQTDVQEILAFIDSSDRGICLK